MGTLHSKYLLEDRFLAVFSIFIRSWLQNWHSPSHVLDMNHLTGNVSFSVMAAKSLAQNNFRISTVYLCIRKKAKQMSS